MGVVSSILENSEVLREKYALLCESCKDVFEERVKEGAEEIKERRGEDSKSPREKPNWAIPIIWGVAAGCVKYGEKNCDYKFAKHSINRAYENIKDFGRYNKE